MEGLVLLGFLLLGWVVIAPIVALIKSSGSGLLNARVLTLEYKVRELEDKLALKSKAEDAASAQPLSAADEVPEVEVEPEFDPSEIKTEPYPPQPLSNDLVDRPAFLYAPATDAVSRTELEEPLAAQAEPEPDLAAKGVQELPPIGTPDAATPEEQNFSPAAPAANPIADAVNWGRDILQKSNLWVLGGVVLLLCALVFLAKLAVEMGWYNPSLRLATGGLVGIVLLCLGWRSREKRPQLGQIMQGGGIAALYLVVIAAVKLPEIMLSPLAGLPLLLAFVLLASLLAILQNAPWMAHLSMISGFFAPLIMSEGSGNYIALFSIFIILNIGVMLIFAFRNWGHLCLTSFVLTYGIGGLWGLRSYHPELWLSVEPFLLAFTACYGWIAWRFSALISKEALPEPLNSGGTLSALLSPTRLHLFFVLGTPTIFMLYQLMLVGHLPMGVAFSGLGLGFLYLAGARLLWKRYGRERLGDAQIYFVLAITGLNLALLFSGLDTGFDRPVMFFYLGVTWVVEGALFIRITRNNPDDSLARPRFMRGLGMVLLTGGALLAFASALWKLQLPHFTEGVGPAVDFHLLIGSVIISVFSLLAAWSCRRTPETEDNRSGLKSFSGNFTYALAFFIGAFWLLGGTFAGFIELNYNLTWSSLALAALVSAAMFVRARLDWPELRYLLVLPVPFAVPALLNVVLKNIIIVLFEQDVTALPEMAFSFIGFVHNIAPLLLLLLPIGGDSLLSARARNYKLREFLSLSAPGLVYALLIAFLPTLVYSLLAPETISALAGVWFKGLLLALSLITLGLLTKLAPAYGRHDSALGPKTRLAIWTASALAPIAQMLIWQYDTLFALALVSPLPYIPLLNILDLGAVIICLTLWFWRRKNALLRESCIGRAPKAFIGDAVICIMAFVAGHGVILRALAALVYGSIYAQEAFSEQLGQVCITLYWGLCGFALMFAGKRLQMRRLWICGATLLLAAAAKTVLVDTAGAATLARVGVYFGIGLLFICTGYFIPVPGSRKRGPKSDPESSSEESSV